MDKKRPVDYWAVFRRPFFTWLALCALLATTCTLAYVPLGNGNLPVSLCIAAIKVSLVGFIFMRLSEDNPLNRLAAFVGPIWVLVLFLLSGADYFTR